MKFSATTLTVLSVAGTFSQSVTAHAHSPRSGFRHHVVGRDALSAALVAQANIDAIIAAMVSGLNAANNAIHGTTTSKGSTTSRTYPTMSSGYMLFAPAPTTTKPIVTPTPGAAAHAQSYMRESDSSDTMFSSTMTSSTEEGIETGLSQEPNVSDEGTTDSESSTTTTPETTPLPQQTTYDSGLITTPGSTSSAKTALTSTHSHSSLTMSTSSSNHPPTTTYALGAIPPASTSSHTTTTVAAASSSSADSGASSSSASSESPPVANEVSPAPAASSTSTPTSSSSATSTVTPLPPLPSLYVQIAYPNSGPVYMYSSDTTKHFPLESTHVGGTDFLYPSDDGTCANIQTPLFDLAFRSSTGFLSGTNADGSQADANHLTTVVESLNSYPDIASGEAGDNVDLYYQTTSWGVDCGTGILTGSWGSIAITTCAVSSNPNDPTDATVAPQSLYYENTDDGGLCSAGIAVVVTLQGAGFYAA